MDYPNIRHVSDPLAAALRSYEDELLKHAPVERHADVQGAVEHARKWLQEAAYIAGVVPRGAIR